MANIDSILGYGEDEEKGVFQFSEKALRDLDNLQRKVRAPSRSATIHYAMRWLQFFVDELEDNGNKPCLETEEGIREVIMPHTQEGCWEK